MVDPFRNSFEVIDDSQPLQKVFTILQNFNHTLSKITSLRKGKSPQDKFHLGVWNETSHLILKVQKAYYDVIRTNSVRKMKEFLEEACKQLDLECERFYKFDSMLVNLAELEEDVDDPDVVSSGKLLENFTYKQGSGELDCAICLMKFREGNLLTKLPCGHSYHHMCLEKWVFDENVRTPNCPICRFSLNGYEFDTFV